MQKSFMKKENKSDAFKCVNLVNFTSLYKNVSDEKFRFFLFSLYFRKVG